MAENYILLERIELNADASSVTFSNIPQSGYTDLKIVASSRTSRTSDTDAIKIRFNGSSSSYTNKVLYGSGSGAGSFAGSTDSIGNAYTASNYLATGLFGSQEFYIPNYTGSSYKSVSVDSVEEANTTYAEMDMIAGLWSNTTAITSIEILPNVGGSLIKYSTFSLYGLAAVGTTPAIAPKATGGNITTDGTYWYHTFLSTGAFVPAMNLTCDYLVVAGGGGAGGGTGGGGGAGGLRSTVTATGGGGSLESAVALTSSTSYTVTIGAGGTAGIGDGSNGGAGVDSSIIGGAVSITSVGGGAGNHGSVGGSGGSGGGAGYTTGSNAGGSATSGQGYAGGSATQTGNPYYTCGGGGGAGAAGTSISNSPNGGAGGNGVQITAFATPTYTGANSGYYAGGGGGGTNGTTASGGFGGGGSSVNDAHGTDGTANTGGGAGGAGTNSTKNGGAGGSGIVIIRYSAA